MLKRSELAQKMRSNQLIVGTWMTIPHPMIAETLAQTGVDFLLVDGEHAPIPPDLLGSLLPSTELHGMSVIYRVRGNRTELIKAALDHGVTGLMVPMINSAIEAEKAIVAAKYPPFGKRGIGAWRASNYFLDEADYVATANAVTPVILQIETKEALLSVAEIAATPGVDALYIGPADLALSLGLAPGELHPGLLDACVRVADAARQNGVAVGIDVASLDFIKTYRDMGFSLFTYGADIGLVVNGGRELQRNFRAMLT